MEQLFIDIFLRFRNLADILYWLYTKIMTVFFNR